MVLTRSGKPAASNPRSWLAGAIAIIAITLATLLPLANAGAQRPTAPRASVSDTLADTLSHPPIAPRKAMLLSFAIPGAAQARLKRPIASMVFATFEVLSIGMARQAAQDLREAKAARHDSVATSFTLDPVTGITAASGYTQNRLVPRIGARHAHYEDWLAAIIFNHVISGVDAYVAANLWDFKANIAVVPSPRGAQVAASLAF